MQSESNFLDIIQPLNYDYTIKSIRLLGFVDKAQIKPNLIHVRVPMKWSTIYSWQEAELKTLHPLLHHTVKQQQKPGDFI